MSHYCVLVIGENPEEQLRPFQEYDYQDDFPKEYLEFYDQEEEFENEYEWESCKMIRMPDGSLVSHWEERFLEGIPKELLPEIDVYHKNRFDSLEEYVKHHHDLERDKNGKYGYWRNPNSKWDWYEIGGRYAGSFILLDEFAYLAKINPPNFSHGWRSDSIAKVLSLPRVDQATKFTIDWSKCHQTEKRYIAALRFWEMKVGGSEPETEEEIEELKWDFYKKEYYLNRYKSPEVFAKCESNFTVWGYVKDGQWFEKGEMGWWGLSGESDSEAVEWELGFFDNVIAPLPEKTLLTIFDCHI